MELHKSLCFPYWGVLWFWSCSCYLKSVCFSPSFEWNHTCGLCSSEMNTFPLNPVLIFVLVHSLSCLARAIWSGRLGRLPCLTEICLHCTLFLVSGMHCRYSCMLMRLLSLEKQMSQFWTCQPWRSTSAFMWCCAEVEKRCWPKHPLHWA